ncbi:putative low-affinity potassium transport protein [Rosellinia necatrix]|uniref:Putative low-affinity potassium transport protein n=1 Tax=Rosellinia necatrix TaxID=77044 RepID=A0A1W2TXB7_ROSNE|nr:putative low-affinity potassium transport protein [Rosellinia necatrix]
MVAESLFVLGAVPSRSQETVISRRLSESRFAHLPGLSKQVTIGRNSRFRNMTPLDREQLGGIEYRSLKLLLKIIIGYYFGLHLLGAIALVPWIHKAPAKYTDFLAELGIGKTWWALYSSQSMINNLGFTLTPNSMISFRDATWPMFIMTFLAYAGNTCYPVLLRLVIWVMSKLVPKTSHTRESLQFLLDHPRRCYTLLFPSKPTWILFGILFTLNFIDVVLIIILDLYNPEVNSLSAGPRVLAALFQAASARHTGAATFNLANVNPAVQFSLLVMMYIAVLPIAVSIRASNTYEEKALGIYESESELDETDGKSYFISHVRNQLSFDLWYIFLGTFIICIAESVRIVDNNEPAFAVFTVFFEVVSAYGNVGLSLGHPSVNTSLSGQFKVISKLVICAMMIRGRHRGLPYSLDKAIMLPGEGDEDQEDHNEMPMAT